jgi:uncharacterized membrane protein
MKALTSTVARILFAVPFIVFGVMHLGNAQAMAGMVPSFIPGGTFWVYVTGIALLLAAASFIIQKYTEYAGLLLAIMLGIFILTIHMPGLGSAETVTIPRMQLALTNLLKDFGLAAGALILAGKYVNSSNDLK